MKPYFAAESPAFDVTVTIDEVNGPDFSESFTLSVPADRYAIGEPCNGSLLLPQGDARNIYRALCVAVGSNSANVGLQFIANSGTATDTDPDLCGFAYKFQMSGISVGQEVELGFSGTNANLAYALFGIAQTMEFDAFTNTHELLQQPLGTWFPKSHLVDRDDWVPHPRDMFHSQITGDGSSTGVEHGDGVQRYWRRWLISAVPGARISNRRASNTVRDWYETAGLSSASGAERVALDHYTSASDYGWWYATQDGKTRFICVEDESASTPEFSRYRFNLADTRAPMSMQSWLSLTDPNVSKYSDGAGRRDVAFCAIEVPL